MLKSKTALVLSGGGSRGAYEVGVWQALTRLGIDIDIVTGSSVGAINGAMIAQGNLDLTIKLWKEMETHMIFDVDQRDEPFDYAKDFAKEILLNKGAGSTGLQELLRQYVDEDTLRSSKTDFGLVAVEVPSMKGHYLFKSQIPKGYICDYITASASAFPAIHSHNINGTSYIDGGYADVLPVKMALSKGATTIIAVYLESFGFLHQEDYADLDSFKMIRSKWDLGNFLLFDKKNTTRLINLGYLDCMKAYGIFDGEHYTFAHGSFDKRTLKQAEAAGRVLDLDPTIIYTKEVFILKAAEAAKSSYIDIKEIYLENNATIKDSPLDWESIDTLNKIKDLFKVANRKTAVLLLAKHIDEKGENSLFISKYVKKLFPLEIAAAQFIGKII